MDIRLGYKQSEVGMIPDDWEVVRLCELSKFKNGLNKAKRFFGTGTPIVNYMDVFERPGLRTDDLSGRVNLSSEEIRNYEVRQGDVFFTRTSETVEEVGVASVMLDNPHDTVFSGFVLRARPHDGRLNDDFKQYCFASNTIRSQIVSSATYTTRALTNGRALSAVWIAIPPKPEQRAIAEALSDVDTLIESLKQLLTKKRQIKNGAMQELLTGKKRLPGFSREWKVKRLGDISEIVMGQSPNSAHYNNKGKGLPLIQGNADIYGRQTIRRVFTTEVTKRGQAGDILMSVRAPVGEISRAVFDICLGRGVCAIRYPENDFLYYALIAREPTWVKLSKGSTFDSVSSTDVKRFEIVQPTDESEQLAIASILSNMDAEIVALEAKVSKARQIKQGMMQELLTGRIRLI